MLEQCKMFGGLLINLCHVHLYIEVLGVLKGESWHALFILLEVVKRLKFIKTVLITYNLKLEFGRPNNC